MALQLVVIVSIKSKVAEYTHTHSILQALKSNSATNYIMKTPALICLVVAIFVATSIVATNCHEDGCIRNAIWNKFSIDKPREVSCDFVCSEDGLTGVEYSGGKCCCS